MFRLQISRKIAFGHDARSRVPVERAGRAAVFFYALNQGVQKKARLWSKAGQKLLCELPLPYWAGQRRETCCG
jgi:hypothetical protein